MPKGICWITATPDEIALLGKHGDPEALRIFWESILPMIDRIAGHFHKKYPWVDARDISQSVACEVPKMIKRFDPDKATKGVNRYFYFAIYRAAQDHLRKEDPLGVGIPHRMKYPAFGHLSDIAPPSSKSKSLVENEIIQRGIENLDRGYRPNFLNDG